MMNFLDYFKKVHHYLFNNQSLELSSLSKIDNIIHEEEQTFKKNPTPINHQSTICDWLSDNQETRRPKETQFSG